MHRRLHQECPHWRGGTRTLLKIETDLAVARESCLRDPGRPEKKEKKNHCCKAIIPVGKASHCEAYALHETVQLKVQRWDETLRGFAERADRVLC